MEELQSRHRKEQKDLQGRITQKKKNATKKTRKGVQDECERLERDLKERQQNEIQALDGAEQTDIVDELQSDDAVTSINGEIATTQDDPKSLRSSLPDEGPMSEVESAILGHTKKPNRQKARLARRAAEQEAMAATAAQEATNQPDLRKQETAAMEKHKKKLKLTEVFIQPDGHCLFSACAHSLPAVAVNMSGPSAEDYQNVRHASADFMMQHRNDFEPFLEEPFDDYVAKIRDTAEWGGQLELQAIAKYYKVIVRVLQADGRVEDFKPDNHDDETPTIWLAYYKHSFGLGEHYNALQKS